MAMNRRDMNAKTKRLQKQFYEPSTIKSGSKGPSKRGFVTFEPRELEAPEIPNTRPPLLLPTIDGSIVTKAQFLGYRLGAPEDEKHTKKLYRLILHMGDGWIEDTLNQAVTRCSEGNEHGSDGVQKSLYEIFLDLVKCDKKACKKFRLRPTHRNEPFRWEERLHVLKGAFGSPGAVSRLTIEVRGRPHRIQQEQHVRIVELKKQPIAELPSGFPAAVLNYQTIYTLYIAEKQFKKLDSALRDSNEVLIAEGYPILHKRDNGISVLVAYATTRSHRIAQKKAMTTP